MSDPAMALAILLLDHVDTPVVDVSLMGTCKLALLMWLARVLLLVWLANTRLVMMPSSMAW